MMRNKWLTWLAYCVQHIIKPYDMVQLAKYENDMLYVDGCGNMMLKDDLTWSGYHGAYIDEEGNAYEVYEV